MGKTPRNFLKLADRMKAASWITARKQRLMAEKPTLETVAAEIERDLKFTVSAGNVRSIRQELGIYWAPPRQTSKQATATRNQRRLRLTRAVVCLLHELNGRVPVQLLRDAELTAEEAAAGNLEDLLAQVAEGDQD